MAVAKRSISMESEVAQRVARAADEDGVSFSTWLTAAAEHQLLLRDGRQGIREWEAEHGPLTDEEKARGRALLDRLLREAAGS